jgi:hypothetical protein
VEGLLGREGVPGARGLYKQLYYNYEAALLAAGVPRNQIYPVTDDKVKLVFQKLNEIKPHVKVWWTAGAQPPQLLSSGELALCSAWTGRILAVMKEKAPVAMTYSDGIAWGNAWVVVKGSPHAKLAMEAINYAISEEAQLRLLDAGTYGPALTTAAAKATPSSRRHWSRRPRTPRRCSSSTRSRRHSIPRSTRRSGTASSWHDAAAARALNGTRAPPTAFVATLRRHARAPARSAARSPFDRARRCDPAGEHAGPRHGSRARTRGLRGTVHAINPNYRTIESYPCVASLADLPAAARPRRTVGSQRSPRSDARRSDCRRRAGRGHFRVGLGRGR